MTNHTPPFYTAALRDGVYQEFKLASSGHDGYSVERPEGIGLVVSVGERTLNIFGHTKKKLSAAADALKLLRDMKADPGTHRIAFVLAAVGIDPEREGALMLPSRKLISDLRKYMGDDLKTIEVFAPHGDMSHELTYRVPAPRAK